MPPIQELFADIEPPSYFPGICVLHNLDNGTAITIRTGQADTEILGVIGEDVIYRVNTKLFSGRVGKGGLDNVHVLADGPIITAIHWMIY